MAIAASVASAAADIKSATSVATASASAPHAAAATVTAITANGLDVRTAKLHLSAAPYFPVTDPPRPDLYFERGSVSRVMHWDELAWSLDRSRAGPYHLLLGRLPAELSVYVAHIANVKQKYAAIEDYVRHVKLHATNVCARESDGKHVAAFAPSQLPLIHVQRNDFPYAVTPDIIHDLIWSAPDPLSGDAIRAIVDREHGADAERLTFEAPLALKSVPGVWHVHVFTRKPKAKPKPTVNVAVGGATAVTPAASTAVSSTAPLP